MKVECFEMVKIKIMRENKVVEKWQPKKIEVELDDSCFDGRFINAWGMHELNSRGYIYIPNMIF